jgi:hypothetical protein
MWHAARYAEQVVEEVAPSYAAMVRGYDLAYLHPYWGTWSGVVYGQRGKVPGALGVTAGWMDQVGMGEELSAEVGDEEGFYPALAERVCALSGVPLLVEGLEASLESQFERLTGAPHEAQSGPSDAVLAWNEAAVVLRNGRLVGVMDGLETPLGWCTRLGTGVYAGRLPLGAAGVSLDGHEAVTAERAWLCVADVEDPLPLYRCAGIEWVLEVPADGMPLLCPSQAPAAGEVTSRTDERVEFEAAGWTVSVSAPPAFALPADLVEDGGWVPFYSMPGTVLGRPHGFEAAQGNTWAAVAECGSFSVTVKGPGEPPERLDLNEISVDAVES